MSETTTTKTAWRRGLPWAPAVLLGLAVIGSWLTVMAGGLTAVFAWVAGLQLLIPALSAIVLLGCLIRIIRKRQATRPTIAAVVFSLLGLWPVSWLFDGFAITYPSTITNTAPSATINSLSDRDLTVYWGGDDMEANYHAVTPDQRWAYDLVILPAGNSSARLTDYGCYGATVLAPADGVVTVAHDGEVDSIPAQPPSNPLRPLGNHIAIKLPSDTWLVIAHLMPGSVSVKEGDVITAGMPIGKCGNSGNTSEPHIHIHHQRQDPKVYPVGLAEGLPLFFEINGQQRMPRGGARKDGDVITLLGETIPHR